MELNLNKQAVYTNEVIFDGQAEQGVEFDYVLPDYYPDIFKILKCTLTPCIISYSVSGTQLYIDGVAYIKVLYLGEENNSIQCVEHKHSFSKTIELAKAADGAIVTITPKTDYCNCRAVSNRRVDVRGAVSVKIKVCGEKTADVISDANDLEVKKENISYCAEKLFADRQFVSREDIETGSGKGGIISIINNEASVEVTDYKVISDKLVVKGDATVKALYLVKAEDNLQQPEVMEATIPISQIINLDGVTDQHRCFVTMKILDCDLEIKSGENGENRMLGCDLTVDCKVTAYLEKDLDIITDLYSTQYETDYTTANVKLDSLPTVISNPIVIKGSLESNDGTLESIYDSRCEISNISCKRKSENAFTVAGQANWQALGKLENGTPVFLERAEPFEAELPAEHIPEEYNIDIVLQVQNVTFSITSDRTVEIRAQLLTDVSYNGVKEYKVITGITVNEEKPKQKRGDYALKLYFAEENEDIWTIAKRYNTSASAILRENDLDGEITSSAGMMLLIPIV
jgi:hypothetical protein